jgi:hypothetical protein
LARITQSPTGSNQHWNSIQSRRVAGEAHHPQAEIAQEVADRIAQQPPSTEASVQIRA